MGKLGGSLEVLKSMQGPLGRNKVEQVGTQVELEHMRTVTYRPGQLGKVWRVVKKELLSDCYFKLTT